MPWKQHQRRSSKRWPTPVDRLYLGHPRFYLAQCSLVAFLFWSFLFPGMSDARAGRSAAPAPPCKKSSLDAGLARGSVVVADGHVVYPFGCSPRYAFAVVLIDKEKRVVRFQAEGSRWATVSRALFCRKQTVPGPIRRPACNPGYRPY